MSKVVPDDATPSENPPPELATPPSCPIAPPTTSVTVVDWPAMMTAVPALDVDEPVKLGESTATSFRANPPASASPPLPKANVSTSE